MKFACVIWLFAPMLTLCLSYGFAQEPGRNLYDMSFEELSKLKIMSASKSEQGLDEIPATLRIVTGTEIRERGYFTLDEVLSDLPGFQFRNIMSLNSYIFQRGIPNQNNLTLVLIDGIQTNELNSGGFYGGGQYDLNNIERIEVVYGPASVAYGTNAVSGIINIVTREAASRGGEIGTALGNFQTHRSHASYRYESRDQTLGISISAQCLQTGKANLKGIHGDNNWTDLLHIFENDYSGHIKIRYKDFTLGTDYMNKQTSTATTQTSVGTGYKDYGSLWNIQFMNNYLKYQKSLNRDWNFSATLYNRNATVMKNTIYYVCDTAQVGYYRPNNLTGLEGIFSYRPGNIFSSTSGALIEYEELAHGPSLTYSSSPELAPPEPDKPGIQRNYLISLFVEPNFRLFRYLMLSGGLRFDQSSIYNQVFTPRAGLKYARTNYSFSLLYAEAFRAPKPWDYTDGLGNPGLQPERIRSFEATASASLFEKVACEVTVYHNLLLDGFQKETSEEGYRWVNDSELKTLGAELALRYSTRHFQANLNYTYNQSSDKNGRPIPEISAHCANAQVGVSLSPTLRFNLRANYVGQRENPKMITTTQSTFIDPYLLLNGALNWTPVPGLTVQLIGKNLLDSEYYHSSNREPDRYRQAQRTLIVSVAYSFSND